MYVYVCICAFCFSSFYLFLKLSLAITPRTPRKLALGKVDDMKRISQAAWERIAHLGAYDVVLLHGNFIRMS